MEWNCGLLQTGVESIAVEEFVRMEQSFGAEKRKGERRKSQREEERPKKRQKHAEWISIRGPRLKYVPILCAICGHSPNLYVYLNTAETHFPVSAIKIHKQKQEYT